MSNETMIQPNAEVRASQQPIVELTHQLSERDRSIQTLLEYVQNSERVIGTYAAEVLDRDQRILLLEQRLSQSRWHMVAHGVRWIAASLLRGAYRIAVPRSTREQLWVRRQARPALAVPGQRDPVTTDAIVAHVGQIEVTRAWRVAVVTRNAVHGGVETMVALHQRLFDATVFVAGGINRPDTCPFEYTYVDATDEAHARQRLAAYLRAYDVIIYHWIPQWAQWAVRDANRPSIEVVHRDDTSDNDKTIPTVLVTHSEYLADFLRHACGRTAQVIPHGVDVDRFHPSVGIGEPTQHLIGGVTSYNTLKGIDLALSAWAMIQHDFPQYGLRFYGSGPDKDALLEQSAALGLERTEILGPVSQPELVLSEFHLLVVPSRAEGMPFAILEALASNVAVVCSDLAPMREFNDTAVKRGVQAPLALFASESVSDLADKLRATLKSLDDARETRSYIERYFSVDEHCRRYLAAMEEAIALHEQAAQAADMHAVRPWRALANRSKR